MVSWEKSMLKVDQHPENGEDKQITECFNYVDKISVTEEEMVFPPEV